MIKNRKWNKKSKKTKNELKTFVTNVSFLICLFVCLFVWNRNHHLYSCLLKHEMTLNVDFLEVHAFKRRDAILFRLSILQIKFLPNCFVWSKHSTYICNNTVFAINIFIAMLCDWWVTRFLNRRFFFTNIIVKKFEYSSLWSSFLVFLCWISQFKAMLLSKSYKVW